MFNHLIVKSLGVLLFLVAASVQAKPSDLSEYVLGSGDEIKISVYDEEDLTVEVRLNDAGTVAYPFLGQLRLKGKTVGQLQELIDLGLRGDYLINPRVSVSIVEYRPFFINGEVEKPGGFPFQPGLTVSRAVSLAEGFTERASKTNIILVHDGDASQEEISVSLNSPVQPGDVITVRQRFF